MDGSKRREHWAGFAFVLLHLLTLWAFAVGQPIYDLLGRFPEFLVARRMDFAELTLLVAVLSIVLPLFVGSLLLALFLLRRPWGRTVQGVIFAVLMALGMKGRQLMRLVMTEALAIGLLGAVVGLLVATPFVYWMATSGLDFAAILGEEMSISGVLYDPVMYADMGLWMIPRAILVAVISTLIAALYPAWSATRTNPSSALSLREA